ncbi:hypothetical protein TOPH_07287 [Tolypocladium ophioglossoides CBS 100239]|uniref:Uncharacterized protein n=1 Tax=Tolypocladium ophioglossoides (strain CBS 100239) TaxID=1163406 RepID=A0A0L0N2K6_TOLOC|nr:hypothetical protein TOPH_07287 [Tolypocladium ophioglossoides CBS 100239]
MALLGDRAPARGFQLEQNPSTQDRWTTWVEYLWEGLQNAGVLRHDEDEESLLDGALRRALEKEDAERALRSLSDMEPRATSENYGRRLLDGRRALEHVERRNDLIGKYVHRTDFMWEVEEYVKRFDAILRWSEEQLSVIERELSASEPAERQNNSRGRTKGVKRRSSATPEQASGGGVNVETPPNHHKAGTKRQRISRSKAAVRKRKGNKGVTPSKRGNNGQAAPNVELSGMAAPRRSARIAKLGALKASARG